jgi:Mg-chelatase subunit ChlD
VQPSSGPHLLHRGSPASQKEQQTVVLIDDGQTSKTGAQDRKQAVQQTVTVAAGLYRQLSAIDRH